MSRTTPILPARPSASRAAHAQDTPSRRRPIGRAPIVALLVAIACYAFLDEPIADLARAHRVAGDLRRELETIQQFGAISSLVLTAWIVAAVDRRGRARLWDLALAASLGSLAAFAAKIFLGRPRPSMGDPGVILGPFGAYPVPDVGVVNAWDPAMFRTAQLWSMPSSHTVAAVILATFLSLAYPRLSTFAWTLAVIVALSRVATGAHYPSDVVVGAIIGWIVARWAIGGSILSRTGRLA